MTRLAMNRGTGERQKITPREEMSDSDFAKHLSLSLDFEDRAPLVSDK